MTDTRKRHPNINTTIRLFVKQLQAVNVELVACAKPFAALLQDHNNFDAAGNHYPDDKIVFSLAGNAITAGDLRRLVVALTKYESEE